MPFQSRRKATETRPSAYGGTYNASVVFITCCNAEFQCVANTNTCQHCQTDYNGFGQQLAPRHFWGEETGETWADCI